MGAGGSAGPGDFAGPGGHRGGLHTPVFLGGRRATRLQIKREPQGAALFFVCLQVEGRGDGGGADDGRAGCRPGPRWQAGEQTPGLGDWLPPDDRSSCTAGLPGKGEGDDAHLRGRETLVAEERAGRSRLRPILAAGGAACRRDGHSVSPCCRRGGPADPPAPLWEGPIPSATLRPRGGAVCQRRPWVRR